MIRNGKKKSPRKVSVVRLGDAAERISRVTDKRMTHKHVAHDFLWATNVFGMSEEQALRWVDRGYGFSPGYAEHLLDLAGVSHNNFVGGARDEAE